MIFYIYFFIIPLPSSRDCSPASGPMTWLMFAAPVRGLELSEIWGLFIQMCEILSQQWNSVFSQLDVAVFFIPVLFQTSSIILYVSEFLRFTLENYEPSSGVEPGSSRFVCSSTVIAGLGLGHDFLCDKIVTKLMFF